MHTHPIKLKTATTRPAALAIIGSLALLMPHEMVTRSASAVPGGGPPEAPPVAPATIRLPGTVWDFHKTHPDFNVTPSAGNGHYAGNVALALDGEGRPVFSGGGYKVNAQWTDRDNNSIAPHLFEFRGSMDVAVLRLPTWSNGSGADSYDPAQGPYGPGNQSGAPNFAVPSPMPAIPNPPDMPLSADFIRSAPGTSIVNGSMHVEKFEIANGHLVQVEGGVTLVVDKLFKLQGGGTSVELLPGASLTLYVGKDALVDNGAKLHLNSAEPDRVVIYNVSPLKPFIVKNQSEVAGRLVSPGAVLQIENQSHFYGYFAGRSMSGANQSAFHLAAMDPEDGCAVDIIDTAGSMGMSSDGGVSSAASFAQWYRDTLGVNLSSRHTIELVRNGAGVYEYLDDEFHPIDDIVFGNEGDGNNDCFTYAIKSEFVHSACTDLFFEFDGTDDAWLFINGQLAMDLGGVVPGSKQYVDIDRLGLADGETYSFHFFYAQRQSSLAIFKMRTNLPLAGELDNAVSAGCD